MKGQIRLHTLKIKNVGRLAVLALLLVAFCGPWLHSGDGTPPAEWCAAPNILLASQRCVRLVPGTEIISLWVSTFIGVAGELIAHPAVLAGRGGEFLRLLLFSLVLFWLVQPFLSTLLLVPGGEGRRRQTFQVVAWALATAVAGWLLTVLGGSGLYAALWGIWLYIGLATSALALEFAALVRPRRPV